jgi:hypothetical protein
MKMHLAMTVAFAGLCSHAAFAASEGGDTWSQLQPQAYTSSIQSPAVATSAYSNKLPGGFAIAANEGGDTWSALQTRADTASTQLARTATSASGGLQHRLLMSGSEGGDTWSELQAGFDRDATSSLMAAR